MPARSAAPSWLKEPNQGRARMVGRQLDHLTVALHQVRQESLFGQPFQELTEFLVFRKGMPAISRI